MNDRAAKVKDLEHDLRDELLSGITEAGTWLKQATKALLRTEEYVREQITMDRLMGACGENGPAAAGGAEGPEFVILHHSTTRDSETFSWSAIRRHHVETLGWRDIGYHFGIELVADGVEVMLGRMPGEVGAHCIAGGMNARSVGVCVVGNYDREDVPHAHEQAALRLVRWVCRVYRIPTENVLGHREVALDGRTCPGGRFDMGRFRSLL